MNNFNTWKKNQKKLKPNLSFAEIIRLGGRKKWYDRDCPEWLWILLFLAFIIAGSLIVANFDRIEPGEVKLAQDEQIVAEQAKTPLDGKMTATGVASWYDYSLNGIKWSKDHDTCAVRDFKRYSMVRATNMDNGKSVDCYVNDYGPETCEQRIEKGLDKPGECIERIIDLSSHAFEQISDLGVGLANVKIEEL
jgi:hypothetical protein